MPTDSTSDLNPSPDPLFEASGGLAAVLEPTEAFRRRIAVRIEGLEKEQELREARLRHAPEPLRMAAGLLPGGLAVAGGVGSKLGLKGLAGLLAVPVVSLALVLVTLLAGLRALLGARAGVPSGGEATAPADPHTVTTAWWRRHRTAATLSLCGLVLLAVLGHPETAVLCVLLAMVTCVLLLGELARHGLADRRTIGKTLARWLGMLAWYAYFPGTMSRPELEVVPAVLVACAPLCLLVSGQLTWRSLLDFLDAPVQRLRHRDRPTVFCLRALMGGVALALVAGGVLVLGVIGMAFVSRAPSRAALVDHVERFDAPVEARGDWEQLGRVLSFLRTDGGPAPRLERVRERLAAALAGSAPLSATVTRVAARFALVPPEVLARWSGSWHPERATSEVLDWLEGEAAGLEASAVRGDLDPALAARLASELAASWPGPEERSVLALQRRRTELLDALGHGADADRHAAEVRAALLASWAPTHTSWRPRVAFQADARSARDAPRDFGSRAWPDFLLESTDDALALGQRHGLPAGLSLEPLRAAVAGDLVKARVESALAGAPQGILAELVAARIEALAPAPRGWLHALVQRRLLLAALALGVLCVVASSRGARSGRAGSRGAGGEGRA